MENDQSTQIVDKAMSAMKEFVVEQITGQLTFHFSNGTLRQIQRNVFETVK